MPLPGPIYPVVPADTDEANPGLGCRGKHLAQERASSGNLSDDPTESGAPVKNTYPFRPKGGG